MKSVVTYVRNLLGWCDPEPVNNVKFKRTRTEDDLSSDDEVPDFKRLKQLKKTYFPDVMPSNVEQEIKDRTSKVRYIPVQLETGHPSTSTPNEPDKFGNRVRTLPLRLVDITENGDDTPTRKPRANIPTQPVFQTVTDDDKVKWVQNKPENLKNCNPKYFINIDDDDDDENDQDDDIILVRKYKPSTASPKPYKYFLSKNDPEEFSVQDNSSQSYLKPHGRRISNALSSNALSPKINNKFKVPPGITKGYKKVPAPLPRWMQTIQTNNIPQTTYKFPNMNGNARSALAELFDLNEKRNYRELIRRTARMSKPSYKEDITNLAQESASFRSTQRSQTNSLRNLKLLERRIAFQREFEATKEYDPLTVASLNSSDSDVEIIPSESSTSSSIRIDPINSLRESFKDKAILKDSWLESVDSKYKEKRKQKEKTLNECRLESDFISKVNGENSIALVERKFKGLLSTPDSLIEELPPTVEFPELTPEQEKMVQRALDPGPGGAVLIEKFGLRIFRRDLLTLSNLNWLNDEVINFYMNLLMQRSQERPTLPKVYATNTFFYPKLMQGGQAGLRRWTRKVDIFDHDLMVVPVHLGVHWCMSLVDFRKRRITYLDSMGGRNPTCLSALLKYLCDEHQDKKGRPFDDKGWKTECLTGIPQQMNGSDCGMFSCTFAEFASRDAPFTFTQAHMPYLRRKAALEILQGKLLL